MNPMKNNTQNTANLQQDAVDISDIEYTPPKGAILTYVPRMERSREHTEIVIPLGVGFHKAMTNLLKIHRIDDIACSTRQRRMTRRGKDLVPLPAKHCSKGVLPYRLKPGVPRGDAYAELDSWQFLMLDLDAVPTSVQNLLDTVVLAFSVKYAVVTTFSCKEEDARARVMIPLSRVCKYAEICVLFWWARRQLIAAGLPETSKKSGEPCLDSRLDSRLFFLPGMPKSQKIGEEGWGGISPKGIVSPDSDPVLDVDAILKEASSYAESDREDHLILFPGIPVPGGITISSKTGKVKSSEKAPATEDSFTEYIDFKLVPFVNETLHSWASLHLAPGRQVSIGSPFRSDGGSGLEGGSLRLHRDLDGRIWAHDFGNNTTYVHNQTESYVGLSPDDPIFSNDSSIDLSVKKKIEISDANHSPDEKLLRAMKAQGCIRVWKVSDLIRGKYLPPTPLKGRNTYIRASHGSGKTELMIEKIREVRKKPDRGPILVFVHRRSLAKHIHNRLGIPCYLDMPPQTLEGDCVVCVDSVERVQTLYENDEFDIVAIKPALIIIDECDQVISHLFGSTLTGPKSLRVSEKMKGLIGLADLVIGLSADMDPSTIRMMRLFKDRNENEAYEDEELWYLPTKHEREWRIDTSKARTDRDLFKEWEEGKRLAIFAQSKTEGERIALQLKEKRPTAKVLVVNAETSQGEAKAFMEHNELAVNYDALVYSPSLGTGFSIDVKDHFHRVYVYSCAAVGTVMDLVQGAMRVRNPIMNEIRCYCAMSGGVQLETDPDRIYETLVAIGDATSRLIDQDTKKPLTTSDWVVGEEKVDGSGHVYLDPYRTWHTRMYALVLSRERRSGGPGGLRFPALKAYLTGIGAEISITGKLPQRETKKINEGGKRAKSEIKFKRAERIASAADISITEAKQIKEASSQDESDAIEKAHIKDFYGKADAATVMEDDGGRLRKKGRNFAKYQVYEKDPDALSRMDKWERDNGYPMSHAHFSHVRSKAVSFLLASAGLEGTPEEWKGKRLDPLEIEKEVSSMAMRYKPILGEIGIPVRSDVRTNPIPVISAALSQMGLSLKVHRSGDKRIYEVSSEDIDKMTRTSSIYMNRIMEKDITGKLRSDSGIDEVLSPLYSVTKSDDSFKKKRRTTDAKRIDRVEEVILDI